MNVLNSQRGCLYTSISKLPRQHVIVANALVVYGITVMQIVRGILTAHASDADPAMIAASCPLAKLNADVTHSYVSAMAVWVVLKCNRKLIKELMQ
jgi:hypothetical protein